jgi:hypothetical protein
MNPDVLDLKEANRRGACAEKGHGLRIWFIISGKSVYCASCQALLSPQEAGKLANGLLDKEIDEDSPV